MGMGRTPVKIKKSRRGSVGNTHYLMWSVRIRSVYEEEPIKQLTVLIAQQCGTYRSYPRTGRKCWWWSMGVCLVVRSARWWFQNFSSAFQQNTNTCPEVRSKYHFLLHNQIITKLSCRFITFKMIYNYKSLILQVFDFFALLLKPKLSYWTVKLIVLININAGA